MRRNPERKLRARASLTYPGFIRLVKSLWSQSHPDIPIVASGSPDASQYPCITYSLELRQPHRDDPKPRFRETVNDEDNKAWIISGQKFQSFVGFAANAQTTTGGDGALIVEELIEAFEVFMQEMIPVYKEMGASEVVYLRRYADSETKRAGEGVLARKVVYNLTTERVISTRVDKLESIVLNVGIHHDYTYTHEGDTLYNEVEPRYYTTGPTPPVWYQKQEDIDDNLIVVPRTSLMVGDLVYLLQRRDKPFPDITPGYYRILNMTGEPFSNEIKYEIQNESSTPFQVTEWGSGTPDDVDIIFYGHLIFVPEWDITPNLVNL